MKNAWLIRVIGLLLLIAGLAIRYIIARRKFNRRAMTGAERFRSYEHAWSITFGERIAKVIANILLLIAILSILSTLLNFRGIYELGNN